MPDREKVMRGLECCTRLGCHHGCEYKSNGYTAMDCRQELERDALALLQEQEHKDKMFHALEDDWKRLKELLKEHETVVRCKDCKHYRINTVYPGTNMIMKYCAKTGIAENSPDWFCADGVAKDTNVPNKEGR